MRKKTNWIDRLCLFSGIGLAAATLLGFLGRFCWVCDLFSHFRVQYFQLCLVLIGVSIWKKNNRQLVCWILLVCVNYAFVLPLYLEKPPVATEQPVRAMLMNLNAANGNAEQVLTAIQKADPDLLLLEEVTPKWAEELSVLNYPYRVSDVRNDCFGIVLLSKHPLSRTHVVFIGSADVPTLVADVHLPQGEISVVGTHPVPPISAEYSNHRNNQFTALSELVLKQKNQVLLIGESLLEEKTECNSVLR